ncbi:hairy and enhancer of split related-7 isoform X2 [Entelurus aequoreus]|uniref:hairy and enhancer of split related-7 isoform X2 n=1 Tax=Entelurus aequoreus TaxID=161455 RepID=UPI002B1D31CE|nr:hairy and enhancer of split related-7 isoform X2 [Entelurus aequoreus]
MKTKQKTEEASHDKKLMKSQVEKRRRERMNHSLDRLRVMLMHEPQQRGACGRRVEKTEILETTVLFLHNTSKAKAASGPSFQDGFSACLQRAARFLGPEVKGLWLVTAVDAAFAARPLQEPPLCTSSSILHLLRQRSKSAPRRPLMPPPGTSSPSTCTESPPVSPALSPSLWRPWP